MTYVVTDNCIACKYTDCVEFYRWIVSTGENMLVIHPDECTVSVCERMPGRGDLPDRARHREMGRLQPQVFGTVACHHHQKTHCLMRRT